MNTQRNASRRLEEEISNAGVPPRGEQVPPLEEDANVEQAPTNPPSFMDENIRTALLQMYQAITTQEQASTIQAQAMMVQANWEVMPRPRQQITTMASHLRDFTRMNPPTFYDSKVDEECHEFINEVSIILLAMGLSTSKPSWPYISSRTWHKLVMCNRGIIGH